MKNTRLIAESVTYLHPDKICDQISDLLLDEYLKQDPFSRVAVETVGGHGYVALFGEITTKGKVDHKTVVKKYYKKLTGQDIGVISHISAQSPEIAQGVNTGGAGDQGIMIGYACRENAAYMPQEMYLARKLLRGFAVDGKSQVTIENNKLTSVVLSVQGKTQNQLKKHVKNCGLTIDPQKIFANYTGAFDIGGFAADSGCTGRKIVVDAYGPRIPVGGGAFSGKDATKVDRSAAYMARWIALRLLKKYGAKETLVKIGYVIGRAEPVMQIALVDGAETDFDYDCRPPAIIERFALRKPIYLDLARNGHFGRGRALAWEKFE
ncbi:methionine adenosyltransferase domain-containing protein [Candidatus Roizmanbacteria bacterium]|nr:methionine adenosyltransferase domain-containing protein [Candidatus Roizmanbacteria bacterium]